MGLLWLLSLPATLSEQAQVSEVQCIVYVRIHDGPLTSPFMALSPHPPQEAAKVAVLALQSIFWGS